MFPYNEIMLLDSLTFAVALFRIAVLRLSNVFAYLSSQASSDSTSDACIVAFFNSCSYIPRLKENLFSMAGIGRQEMVALALLFGCDYCNGVPGVGIKTALKLLEELRGTNILDR